MAIFNSKMLVSEVGIRRLNQISEHQDRTPESPKQASSSGENMLADGGNLGKPI